MVKLTMSHRNNIIKLPGLADPHVHFREPGATHKEDFSTGTKAAIAGGYTQVLDMPNNQPPTITPTTLENKIKLAKGKIWCDVGFNFGGTASSAKYFKKVYKKVFGVKVYMNHTTGPLLIDKLKEREIIFKSWTSPLPVMVHAEGETVEVAIKLAKKYQKNLHVCHVTADQLPAIEKAKKEGVVITSEVTPHHLFLSKKDMARLGPYGMMKPPLLSKSDQQKLWKNIDKIDVIATDHAPHTKEEKEDKSSAKYGVPGLETTLPLMFDAIARGMTTTERLIEMISTNPRRIFHLPQQLDTFVLLDFSKTFKISKDKLFTKCAWTPFEGMSGRGEVKKVVMRGKTVFQDGGFVGRPSGKVIYPEL
ncbi:MAG: dihydroorotase family protein [Candidatus Curtissbacteria bacterium]|nr:dihydroorotase family protein [Candidatus Curtissbacteria bacterium]